MSKNIAAFTPPGTNPPYVSINYERDDTVSISVRGEPREGEAYGLLATIKMSMVDWEIFRGAIDLRGASGDLRR